MLKRLVAAVGWLAVCAGIPTPRSPRFRGGGFSLATETVKELADNSLEPGTPVQDHWSCRQVRVTDLEHVPRSSQVAVVIPFREQTGHERLRELNDLLDVLLPFTKRAASNGVTMKIFVIEQSSRGHFNRGALMDVGFRLADDIYRDQGAFTVIAQDCDFVPDETMVQWYDRQGDGPIHLASYVYCPGFGGVTIFRDEQFTTMDGYSHSMWGWGGEDDDAMDRWMSDPDRIVLAPGGPERFKDLGKAEDSHRDKTTYNQSMRVWQRDNSQQAWVREGLSGLKYAVVSTKAHNDDAVHHVVVDIGDGGDRKNQL